MTTLSIKGNREKTLGMVYAAMFAALMMIGANVTTIAPFLVVAGVPITLQTFFAVLAGILLGRRIGALSMTLYMALGLVGAPVFARFEGGAHSLLLPTFGFIVSFILVAYVAGWIAERWKSVPGFIVAAFVGTVINYVVGTNWLYVALTNWVEAPEGFSYKMAWAMLVPPMPKDFVLAIFAGIFGFNLKKRMMKGL